MRGQVLGVDVRTGDGIVLGDDGQRYTFRPKDWAHRGEPAIGMFVDFENRETRALSIFPVPGAATPTAGNQAPESSSSDRNKYIAALLAFFLGVFGLHRFYLGRTASGIVMLVLTFTIIGVLLSWPWSMIDMVRYLGMSNREFDDRYGGDDH
ncbi:TM2 domain-containing protein [Sphingosinicella rhizophila]|uniref:TM2 domain-containing protein n=1 Tax=Sphingosinicella rhizophila TaxID=3050082 RepID=A0ABU3QAQ0_9SPHN|nr:TM2 domain-containing protein [Sphingosinicella sp. GR2756]MDT9600025.1 TM2 domain-containing protein [Sphingosinicella sp. GR2756]